MNEDVNGSVAENWKLNDGLCGAKLSRRETTAEKLGRILCGKAVDGKRVLAVALDDELPTASVLMEVAMMQPNGTVVSATRWQTHYHGPVTGSRAWEAPEDVLVDTVHGDQTSMPVRTVMTSEEGDPADARRAVSVVEQPTMAMKVRRATTGNGRVSALVSDDSDGRVGALVSDSSIGDGGW